MSHILTRGALLRTLARIQKYFEANCRFHETLASWSGNRFARQALQRINSLRRLFEYRMIRKHAPRVGEHLLILEAIERQDLSAPPPC